MSRHGARLLSLQFFNDDSVSIVLDTLHDNRSGYLFRTNPLGTQYDALVTDEGRVTDVNWNETWNARATVDESGWAAEIEIPFKALRLASENEQVWGIDFERVIRRKSEFTYWSNYKRSFEFTKVSQAGNLNGLTDLDSGLTLRIKPFVKSALTEVSANPANRPPAHTRWDIGLEDVKYRITPNFTADFTANTDFAEADVDAQVLNLTRFPVYFTETREFFVEGAGIFDYGPGGGATSELKLFFSRSVGLSPDREVIPIVGGGKLTGKSGGWTVGLLDVQTGAFGRIAARNFAVARVKKDIFSRSNLGAIVTKYNAVLIGFPLLVRVVQQSHPEPHRARWRVVMCLIAGCGLAAGLLAGTPFAVVDYPTFLRDTSAVQGHFVGGHMVDLGRGWTYHLLVSLRYGVGAPVLVAALIGSAWLVRTAPATAAVAWSFPVAYYFVIGAGRTVFVRYIDPLLPFVCTLAAVAIARVVLSAWRAAGPRGRSRYCWRAPSCSRVSIAPSRSTASSPNETTVCSWPTGSNRPFRPARPSARLRRCSPCWNPSPREGFRRASTMNRAARFASWDRAAASCPGASRPVPVDQAFRGGAACPRTAASLRSAGRLFCAARWIRAPEPARSDL